MFLYKHKSILSLLATAMHCKMILVRVPDECHSLGSKAALTVDVLGIREGVKDVLEENSYCVWGELLFKCSFFFKGNCKIIYNIMQLWY